MRLQTEAKSSEIRSRKGVRRIGKRPDAIGTTQLSMKKFLLANVAQLVELLICNQPVGGSSPSIGSWRREDTRVAKGGRL